MSNYFKNFPVVDYRFGNNELPVQFQHLGTYIDIIDQVKEYSMFYESYFIPNGMRPDQVSSVLYGTPNNYWTFWLLNDITRTFLLQLMGSSLLRKPMLYRFVLISGLRLVIISILTKQKM